jgi:methyl-accepting chemotaxis protein
MKNTDEKLGIYKQKREFFFMKLKAKLQLGFIIPALLLSVMGIGSIIGFFQINRQVKTIYDDRLIPIKQLKTVSDEYLIGTIDSVNKIHAQMMNQNDALVRIDNAQKTIKDTWDEYMETYLTPEEKVLVNKLILQKKEADEQIEELKKVLQTYDGDILMKELERFDGPLYQYTDPLSTTIEELITLQLDVAEQEREKAENIFNLILWTFVPFLGFTVILIVSPLRTFISGAIISTFQSTINSIASASNQIATASEEQARIAQQQSVSVSKTSTTMDELQASATQSAQQAETSANSAQEVLSLSQSGNQAVEKTLEEMSELKIQVNDIAVSITQLNQQIGQIDTYQKLVAEIANQTNMLALNAAVEAVRAGDHGKGFSVVASEIRKLADQSKISAQKIDGLITDIQKAIKATIIAADSGTKKVDESVKIAEDTAHTFRKVGEAIDYIVINSQQISLTAKQQAIAIAEVVNAMNSLNQGAKETATGINQTQLGTQKLNQAATQLKEMV